MEGLLFHVICKHRVECREIHTALTECFRWSLLNRRLLFCRFLHLLALRLF